MPRTRDQLLDALNRIQPPAFEEVVFRLKLPKHHIGAAETARTVRAIAVVEMLEHEGRLEELEACLVQVASIRSASAVEGEPAPSRSSEVSQPLSPPSAAGAAASPQTTRPAGDAAGRATASAPEARRVAGWPLLVLHPSDLHFGKNGRFRGEDPVAVAKRFVQAINEARAELGFAERVDLMVVTGDVAEAARRPEYEQALAFFNGLVGGLGLPARRVVFVPGNHDVSWHETRRAADEADAEGFDDAWLRRRVQEVKLAYFDRFLAQFHGQPRDQVDGVQSIGHGAFLYSDGERRVAVAALNTCEREWHREQGGLLGESQARALMAQWRQPEIRDGWVKIVALHHNPVATVPDNVRSWAEYLRRQADKKTAASSRLIHSWTCMPRSSESAAPPMRGKTWRSSASW